MYIHYLLFFSVSSTTSYMQGKDNLQGRKWRVGRVGNCPPSFGRIEGAAGRWRGGRGAPHYYLPTQFKVATYTPDLSQKLYLPTMQCAKKILSCFVDEILGYNLHWFFPLCYSWKLHKFWLTTFYEKTSNF